MQQVFDHPSAIKKEIALRAAIALCKQKMRAAKKRNDMRAYTSYMRQMYALQQQLRNATRGVKKGG